MIIRTLVMTRGAHQAEANNLDCLLVMSDRKEEPDFGGFTIPVKCLHSAGAAAGGFGVLSHYLTAKKVGDALLCDVGVNEVEVYRVDKGRQTGCEMYVA